MLLFLTKSLLPTIAQMGVHERLEAIRRLNSGGSGFGFQRDKWFIVLGWSVIAVLTMLLIAVRRMRLEKEKLQVAKHFSEQADRLGLTAEEREIVEAVAHRARVKRKESIFTMNESFDNGLAILMQEVFTAGQNLVERKKLHCTIFSIKEKLGFIKAAGPDHRCGKEQSSRQIPVGTVVQIGLAASQKAAKISAEVVENDRYELLLKPEIPLLCRPGEVWTVTYFKAAMTWEFEAITMTCNEKGLALNHSDRIRFLNRRRFTRVALRRPAKVASFPIFPDSPAETQMGLQFSDAELTEAAGPGLRLKTKLPLKLQQRVLVQFVLEPGHMVQDIAIVREIREGATGHSVIVELIGVDNRAVDELVGMTNRIAVQDFHLNDAQQEENAELNA